MCYQCVADVGFGRVRAAAWDARGVLPRVLQGGELREELDLKLGRFLAWLRQWSSVSMLLLLAGRDGEGEGKSRVVLCGVGVGRVSLCVLRLGEYKHGGLDCRHDQ